MSEFEKKEVERAEVEEKNQCREPHALSLSSRRFCFTPLCSKDAAMILLYRNRNRAHEEKGGRGSKHAANIPLCPSEARLLEACWRRS